MVHPVFGGPLHIELLQHLRKELTPGDLFYALIRRL